MKTNERFLGHNASTKKFNNQYRLQHTFVLATQTHILFLVCMYGMAVHVPYPQPHTILLDYWDGTSQKLVPMCPELMATDRHVELFT